MRHVPALPGVDTVDPSVWSFLLIVLVLPLAVGAVITVIGMAPSWRRQMRSVETSTSTDVARREEF